MCVEVYLARNEPSVPLLRVTKKKLLRDASRSYDVFFGDLMNFKNEKADRNRGG